MNIIKQKPQEDTAKTQAQAQLENVREMVKKLKEAQEEEDQKALDDASTTIWSDALSVEVRSSWQPVIHGQKLEATQYRIVLCTGGPHVEIQGDLDQSNEPENAGIFYQDWFTGLQQLNTKTEENDDLLTYAQQFYYGE